MEKRRRPRLLGVILYVAIIAFALYWLMSFLGVGNKDLTYSEVIDLLEKEQVKSFEVSDGHIYMNLHKEYNGQKEVSAPLPYVEKFIDQMGDLVEQQRNDQIITSYNYYGEDRITPADFILPALVVGVILLFLWVLMVGRVAVGGGGGPSPTNFGKARTTQVEKSENPVTFRDVAGMDEEKQELEEIVDFLRDPEKYKAVGAKIPHGILLQGPPGTGKTLLAKAVAGEAEVAFLSISGSDFVEMYVGVGASRVRDLFEQAKRQAPAIIFIDEIDAVGRKRGSGLGGGHDEKEQTLNQMLVEMDGFERTEGVIVMAATNRPDILDPALLRPGRFDRQIQVGLPDVKGRKEILQVHSRNKKLGEDVDLSTVARFTAGFSGADLSNLMNEAAILAARENRKVLTMKDLDEAVMKITAGPEKRSRVKQRKDLSKTAVHEAGHAVAMYHLPTQEQVLQITIVPRGRSLGATWHLPKDDTSNLTRNEMYEEIVSLLGGRVAEALYLGDISVGASNDIDRVTKIAKDMVARYGMCERLGTVSYLDDGEVFIGRDYQTTKSYSEKYAASIDDEVKNLVDKAYAHCEKLLKDHEDQLRRVVDFLVEHETMTGKQFVACMEGREIPEDNSETVFFDGMKETASAESCEECRETPEETTAEPEKTEQTAEGTEEMPE